MRKAFGVLCMLAGVAMLLGAGWLLMDNSRTEADAGRWSVEILEEMKLQLSSPQPTELPEDTPASALPSAAPETPEIQPTATPLPTAIPQATAIPEMPTQTIRGNEYIGYLELPTLGLSLPVMADWSYPKLRIAPCRYWGNAYDGTLVILAHNYNRHFGGIRNLSPGEPAQFIDANGNILKYTVAAQESLGRYDVQKLVDSEYDLTLCTCTYGGESRIAVRLVKD